MNEHLEAIYRAKQDDIYRQIRCAIIARRDEVYARMVNAADDSLCKHSATLMQAIMRDDQARMGLIVQDTLQQIEHAYRGY